MGDLTDALPIWLVHLLLPQGQEGARREGRQEGGTGFWERRRVLHGHQE
jgi:hypothetical protein